MTVVGTADSGKLSRSTTAADVAKILRKRILAGAYSEDQFIRQETIAQELGVSRIPVREALTLLVAEGLLIREKYRGAVVPKLSLTEIDEIYALRLMIESYLLRSAISRITPAQIAHLQAVITQSRNTQDMSEWAGLNVDFHRALYEAADKPLSMQLLDNLLVRADRYLKMQRVLSTDTQQESDAEHQRVLDFVIAGDVDGAVTALCEHITWNRTDVARMIGLPRMPTSDLITPVESAAAP
jgi:DNA-binding GntR family transcriptional regulator